VRSVFVLTSVLVPGIALPVFAVELARSKVPPNWMARTLSQGQVFTPEEAAVMGLLDELAEPEQVRWE
jgi:enoyl-CoA hydratase